MRDPLYGFIGISGLESRVIDSSAFRRLQFVKQLSHAYVAYPAAVHTRFEHSLGTVFLAGKIADELSMSIADKEDVRLASLLHDVGHGPFSHLFEHALSSINPNQRGLHEQITRAIINEDDELKSILGDKAKKIAEILAGSPNRVGDRIKLPHSIVSGSLDVDKLDYLRRDSHHIGVAYGQFDLDRILYNVSSTEKDPILCIDIKGKDALESYRLARYLMHVQVYEHHARLAADAMFLRAFNIAVNEEGAVDKRPLIFSPHGRNAKFVENYKTLDDYSVCQQIINSSSSKASKEILLDIRRRKLLKRACQFTATDLLYDADVNEELLKMGPRQMEEISNDVARSLRIDPHNVIFHKSEIDMKLYGKGGILYRDGDAILDLDKNSPISAQDPDIKYYVFGPPDIESRKKIADKMSSHLGVGLEKIAHLKDSLP